MAGGLDVMVLLPLPLGEGGGRAAAQRRHVLDSEPQVGLDHARMLLHLLRRAGGQHLALVHGQHAVADLGHQRHVVLHHQHRDAQFMLDVLDPERHVLGLLDVEAGGGLVQQQQLGLGAQRPRQFHHLAHAIGQPGDHRVAVVLQVQQLDHLFHLFAGGDLGGAHLGREEHLAEQAVAAGACAGRSAGCAARRHARTARCSGRCGRCPARRCGAAAAA
jgi:hypothetical protein